MNPFSYEHYITLIKTISESIPVVDFADILYTDDSFFILRHDVEFSVEKAYEMAKIEHDVLGIKSSYFFQIRNYAYNTLAFKNIALIKKIHLMGHKIGLHVNTGGLNTPAHLTSLIKKDVGILQSVLDLPVDRFSFHRPSDDMLEQAIQIEGLINAYEQRFFHFYKNEPPPHLNVHYFADSEHKWKYGNPLSILEKPVKKIQLLIHPYSWSKQGLDNTHNFQALIQLKQAQMLHSMQDECRNFPTELLTNEKI